MTIDLTDRIIAPFSDQEELQTSAIPPVSEGRVWPRCCHAQRWMVDRARANLHLMAVTRDPVLTRFRAALDAAYGDRIERVVLFGSRARGDHRPDSDYDVAVFLKDYRSFGLESKRLAKIEVDILYDTGALVGAMPLAEGAYRERTSFMAELRRDGVDV